MFTIQFVARSVTELHQLHNEKTFQKLFLVKRQKNEFLQSKTLFFSLSAIACFKADSVHSFSGLDLYLCGIAANYATKTTAILFMENNL